MVRTFVGDHEIKEDLLQAALLEFKARKARLKDAPAIKLRVEGYLRGAAGYLRF